MSEINYHKALAMAQWQVSLGVEEIQSNWSPKIKEYLDTKSVGITFPASWCAAFLAYCFDQVGGCPWAGVKNPAYVPDIVAWASDKGWYKLKADYANPKPGDLLIMGDQEHIGIVERYDGHVLTTIEGNTSDPSGAGPDGLYRKFHSMTDAWVAGFIVWPVIPLVAAPTHPLSRPSLIKSVTILLDGKPIEQGDIKGGHVYAPVARILDAMGVKTEYKPNVRELRITTKKGC